MKKQNNSLPEKKREEGHGKLPDFINVDMTKSEIYIDLKNSYITGQVPLQDKLRILDLPKLHTLTNNEKFHLLSVFFSSHDQIVNDIYFDRANNIITPSGISYISGLLNDAVGYYENYLLRTIGISFTQKRNKKKLNPPQISFKDTRDVLNFIDATTSEKNSKADRQIDCSLLKIAICINEYKEHEKEISEAETKFKEIKEENFFPCFYDDKGKEIDYDVYKKCFETPGDCDYVQLQTIASISRKETIFFNSSWRIKDQKKIVLKMLSNRKYDSISAIKDIYGIRNEVKRKEYVLYLLEYIRLYVLKKKGEIIDKNIFVEDLNKSEEEKINESINFVNSQRNNLDIDFFNYLVSTLESEKLKIKKKPIKKDDKKISQTNINYRDIKIDGKLGGKNIEIQINLVNSKNEKGYSHHMIYDAKAKIQALSRLQSYISEPLIKRYINEAIDKNIQEDGSIGKFPELLTLGGFKGDFKKISTEEKKLVIQKIFSHLHENENIFLKLDIPGKQHPAIYTTIDHRNAYHLDEDYKKMYPDGAQIEFNGKWTNNKI